MKRIANKIILVITIFVFSNTIVFSQSYKLDKQLSKMNISGTSSLHDWQMDVGNFTGNFDFTIENEVVYVSLLDVSVETQSISSSKRIMNKKTEEALNTSDYPVISFKYQEITNVEFDGAKLSGKVLGIITIKDVSKEVVLSFSGFISEDKSLISINGTSSVLMTDFNIKPPVALMGTVETDELVFIKFTIVLKVIN